MVMTGQGGLLASSEQRPGVPGLLQCLEAPPPPINLLPKHQEDQDWETALGRAASKHPCSQTPCCLQGNLASLIPALFPRPAEGISLAFHWHLLALALIFQLSLIYKFSTFQNTV